MKEIMLKKSNLHKGHLILVNNDYPINDSLLYAEEQMVSLNEEFKNIYLEFRVANLLTQLFKKIGCKDEIVPVSGFRSYIEQEQIYHSSLAEKGESFTKKYVALPNKSEHQTGFAVDLAENAKQIDFITPNFPDTGLCGEFKKIAAKYGFVERYRKSKEKITGISHEPWHFRYVGYPHAQIMQDNDLCLEEYILFIKEFEYGKKTLILDDFSKKTEIFYVPANKDYIGIEIPQSSCFQISGNNIDGFIVTVWCW